MTALAVVLGGILWRSQVLSYAAYVAENRAAQSYAAALRAGPAAGSRLVCGDFFVTDILALLLGNRPDYQIARDRLFAHPIARLKGEADLPAGAAKERRALFGYLAATGTTPDDLARRLRAVVDPGDPDWQDRFLLGGCLYNYADFWAPLTHGRDTRLAWVTAQLPAAVAEYRRYLAADLDVGRGMLVIVREDAPRPLDLPGWTVRQLADRAGLPDVPLRVFRVEPAAAH